MEQVRLPSSFVWNLTNRHGVGLNLVMTSNENDVKCSYYTLNNSKITMDELIAMKPPNVQYILDNQRFMVKVREVKPTPPKNIYPSLVVVVVAVLFVMFNMTYYYDLIFSLVHEQELSGNNKEEQ